MNFSRVLLASTCTAAFAVGGWYAARTVPSWPWGTIAGVTGIAPAGIPSKSQTDSPPFEVVNGEPVVTIAADAQRAARIEVATLKAVDATARIEAFATVVDVQPLFDLRSRFSVSRDTVEGATASATASREQYERTKALAAKDALTQRDLQSAEAILKTDQDKLDSATATQKGLAENATLQLGPVIANAIETVSSDLMQKLLAGTSTLLLVSLPSDKVTSAPEQITIDVPGAKLVGAFKLSPSPHADPTVQGLPYFYLSDASIPVGTHAMARVDLPNRTIPGVLVPNAATVRYGGQRWVYVRTAPDRFTRRLLEDAATDDDGTIATGNLKPGDPVVVQGAQLLLSQELRPPNIAPQCPDPPECDG